MTPHREVLLPNPKPHVIEGLNQGLDGEGVPQGSPMSPLLSTIILGDTIMSGDNPWDTCMYADDGICYGDDVEKQDLLDHVE